VFIVIFVGIALACITLAIEYCYFKFHKKPLNDEIGSTTTIVTPIGNRSKLDAVYFLTKFKKNSVLYNCYIIGRYLWKE